MDYGYNYAYLKKFMTSKNLNRRDILEAIDSKDYATLNKWIEGKNPVHITALCRLCNYYQEPLENFFFDLEGLPAETKKASINPALPGEDTQELPTDNHRMKEGFGRSIIETSITHRNIGSAQQAKAVEEGLARQSEQKAIREQLIQQEKEERGTGCSPAISNEAMLQLQLEHTQELREKENQYREKEDRIRDRFDAERDRLLRIIEQQNEEISRLTRDGGGQAKHFHIKNSEIGIVAEQAEEYSKP